MSIFSTVPVKKVRKTKFDLSHDKKLSLKMGKIVPVGLMEVLPSDSFKWSTKVFLRFAPMIAPTMEKFYCNIHYFFVPNRLVWDEWEDFITGGEDGTLEPIHPFNNASDGNKNNLLPGSLADYLGVPSTESAITVTSATEFSTLPFRGYQLIYNEYYRDQNLTQPVNVLKTSGGISGAEWTEINVLRNRAWKKDYFTSALPFAQRGAEVTLPFDNVSYKAQSDVLDVTGAPVTDSPLRGFAGQLFGDVTGSPTIQSRIENIESIGAPTINELRKAYRLQEWLENNARGGARYIEQIMSHFNQKSSDARLQRPEYLGGGKTEVVISEVLNTTGITSTGDGGVQGRMAGHAVSIGRTNSFKRKFEEHGYIFALMSVMSYPTYFQGFHRHWSRKDKLDYAFPEFANIGEQEILNKELYNDYLGTDANNELVFGYTPRYSEYKYACNSIHGDFKTSLKFWHYAQEYGNQPALNTDFVEWKNDNRIFNVDDRTIDNVYAYVSHKVSAIRPLPYFGTPRT